MEINQKTYILLISLMSVFLLLSCTPTQMPPQVILQPEPVEIQQNASVAQRFQESAPQNPSVVQSAMELSKKHAKLSEEAAVLRQQNKDFNVQNQQLKKQVDALEAQLQQTQKELTEANDLLITMRVELNNWKVNILGFRDEMRDAETAQLEALFKILTVLGGQVGSNSAEDKNTSSAIESLSKVGQSKR